MLLKVDPVERPLFARFPLEVEFERRRSWIQAEVARRGEEGGAASPWLQNHIGRVTANTKLTLQETLAEYLVEWGRVSGIRLCLNQAVLHDGPRNCRSEDGLLMSFLLEIPFEGDNLWDLYPGKPFLYAPEGVIIGDSLFMCLCARDRPSMLEEIPSSLQEVQAIISEQNDLIGRFNQALPDYVGREIRMANTNFTYQ